MRLNQVRAFPTHEQSYEGMDLRDWFAGQALASLAMFSAVETNNGQQLVADETAKQCYLIADAMMRASGGRKFDE